jgi:hypothetical protein
MERLRACWLAAQPIRASEVMPGKKNKVFIFTPKTLVNHIDKIKKFIF